MDENRRELYENIDKYRIGLDDTFAFKCRACGNCCWNLIDIILTPLDIYNMSKELGVTHQELIKTYCKTFIGATTRILMIRLKPKQDTNVCPLFKDNRCIVHQNNAKPVMCALFPLGRILVVNENKVEYVFKSVSCGSTTTGRTVREWLDMSGIPVNDDFFITWHKIVREVMTWMRRYDDNEGTKQELVRMFREEMLIKLYIAYDTQDDFISQFTENTDYIFQLFETLDTVFQMINSDSI